MIDCKMTDYKQTIIDALDVMRRRDVAEKQTFKARAYAKVIDQLKLKSAIRSMEDIEGITGVGEKIREKIEEILATGSLQSAEKAKETFTLKVYDELLACYGIGPAKAKELVVRWRFFGCQPCGEGTRKRIYMPRTTDK